MHFGIPTVVETAVLVNDCLDLFIEKLQDEARSNDYLNKLKEEDNYEEIKEALIPNDYNLIVTPKEIDDLIENMKEVVASRNKWCIIKKYNKRKIVINMKNKMKQQNQENFKIENRTIEELLKKLREEKNWTYLNLIDELYKIGFTVNEKTIKKWEIGLEYPDLDAIYKLSELYMVPSENFIIAKKNSFDKAYNSTHMTLIKWICYIGGFSYKVGLVLLCILYAVSFVLGLMLFCEGVKRIPYL